MARLFAYYSLCPLIDQKSILGVAEDSTSGCVIVTLGKNIVIRYKLLNQKQINSWSSKEKLSSPVIYDSVGNQYIAVFNKTQLRIWTENVENLDRVKKIKFQEPIHCILPHKNGNEPLIIFNNGVVTPLSKALETRETENQQSQLSSDEIIEDCHLVTHEDSNYITIFSRNSKQEMKYHVIPLSESTMPLKLNVVRENVNLIGQTTLHQSCQLLTLWSDGKIFSLPFLQESPQFPGTFMNTMSVLSTKHPVAMTSLSSSHVAIYGADPTEEGAVLAIYNLSYGVVQSRHHFKLFASPPRLWCMGTNLMIATAHNLVVVPYNLETQRLSALVGALYSNETQSKNIPERSLIQVLQFCLRENANSDEIALDSQLLGAIISTPHSDVCLLPYLRMTSFPQALRFLQYLAEELESEESEIDLSHLLDWTNLLLDAHYQRYLLSGDQEVLNLLCRLRELTIQQIEHIEQLKELSPLLRLLQEGKLPAKKPVFANKLYSIELMRLY
ncbi:hypothetical protein C0J52_06156 [Blattella germanica]|nr:hypothetical protein C0J52_06156 [Blattella germanica]